MKPRHTYLIQVLVLALAPRANGHTWIEQIMRIASNGTLVGTPGYIRGYVDRSHPLDPLVWRLPGIGSGRTNAFTNEDLMCQPTQSMGNQTAGFPALVASPGDQVALRYQENGHVTQPQVPVGRPAGSGTIYVYATEKPLSTDTYLGIHKIWNTAGTGGDGRGVLLATRYFDDGQCYQVNDASAISVARQAQFSHKAEPLMEAGLWCQTDIQIPATATGNMTLYWVWDWPILSTTGDVASNESYTSCMDIVLTPSSGQSKAEAVNFQKGQDLNSAAIAAQMSTAFLVDPTAPLQTFVAGSAPAPFTGSVANPSGVAAPAQSSVSAPNSHSVTLPTASPGVQVSTSASSPKASASSQAPASGPMVTVTVTADAAENIVTVTKTVNGDSAQATGHAVSHSSQASSLHTTQSMITPATSKTASTQTAPAAVVLPSGTVPAVMPFLTLGVQGTQVVSISASASPSKAEVQTSDKPAATLASRIRGRRRK